MANSKERRTAKRSNAEQNIEKRFARPKKHKKEIDESSQLTKAWAWISGAFALGATLIGYLTLIPHLTLQPDFAANPSSPYSESFSVENEGFLYAKSLSVSCTADTFEEAHHMTYGNNTAVFPNLVPQLGYKARKSLPCDKHLVIAKVDPSLNFVRSRLDVSVTYGIWVSPFHRTQKFHLDAEPGPDNQYHWVFN